MKLRRPNSPLNTIVIVAALGYFVDVYDLILFGIVKNPSLIDLGINDAVELFSTGNLLLSIQMAGMLVGGIVFGILGDKRGRLSTLFLTITLYSLANIANGFVQTVPQYAILRFISGFGLSGELGVGITLVSEIMTKETRALGAGIVSGIGVAGSILGFLIVEKFNWRVAYWSGGAMGLLLLFLRMAVYESGMFEKVKSNSVSKGNFMSLFTNRRRFKKFGICILIGIPTWFVISTLAINSVTFAEEALHIAGKIKGSTSVMWLYVGASVGSFLVGFLANKIQSRRKTILLANLLIAIFTAVYFLQIGSVPTVFYCILFLLGLPVGGLWTVFMTSSSEQFGTNIRATVTTSAPNFVRGATILVTYLLGLFKFTYGLFWAGIVTGTLFIGIAIIATFFVEETYNKELDYIED